MLRRGQTFGEVRLPMAADACLRSFDAEVYTALHVRGIYSGEV